MPRRTRYQVLGVVILLTSLGFGGMPGTTCEAATYHVSPSGSNTPPYDTYAKAAHHPRDAIQAAAGLGDTVLIHTGSYDIDTSIWLPPGLSIRGVDRDSVTLIWSRIIGRAAMFYGEGDHDFSGLTFRNPLGHREPEVPAIAIAPVPGIGDLQVSSCRFDWMHISMWSRGHAEIFGNEFLVRSGIGVRPNHNCCQGSTRIYDNLFRGAAQDPGTGVRVYAGDVLIEHNTFDWTDTGLRGYPVWAEYPSFGRVTVRNNLILGGAAGLAWFSVTGEVANNIITGPENPFPLGGGNRFGLRSIDTLVIRNNVFLDLTWELEFTNECGGPNWQFCPSTGPLTFVHNAFWPPRDSFAYVRRYSGRVWLRDSGNFSAWPMFADTAYHLEYGSPLIDAGDPALSDPDGSRSDIGVWGGPAGMVYEYVDLPPSPPPAVVATGEVDSVHITWTSRGEGDLAGHRLYRGVVPGFWNPGIPVLLDLPRPDTSASDRLPTGVDSAFYVVLAYDSAGQVSGPSAEVRYLVDDHPANRPPTFAPLSSQVVRVNDSLTLAVSATDPDGDSLWLTAEIPFSNAGFTDLGGGSGLFTFRPDMTQVGDHIVMFVASDGELADTLSAPIHVEGIVGPALPPVARIARVYPNPINDAAVLDVDIPDIGAGSVPVEIVVFDILGRRADWIYDGSLPPGRHPVVWNPRGEPGDGPGLASGVYFIMLKVRGRPVGDPHKVVLLR